MISISKYVLVASLILGSISAFADGKVIRWTASEDQDASIDHVIQVLNKKTNNAFTSKDFLLQEDRDLAFNHYKRWTQLIEGTPISGKSIRTWTELGTEKAVQVEADLESAEILGQAILGLESLGTTVREVRASMSSEKTMALTRKSVRSDRDDPFIRGLDWKDEWQHGQLMRLVKVRGKHGYHHIAINLHSAKVVSREYREFPQADRREMNIPVQVFPIYEEAENDEKVLPRVPGELRHVYSRIPQVSGDIYGPLKTQHYYDFKFDPALGETVIGRQQGYWSMNYVKNQAAQIRETLPRINNDWATGVLLQGRFATINIHPDAIQKFAPLTFKPLSSPPLYPNWLSVNVDGRESEEMIPGMAYSGKPLFSLQEAWDRPARRLADHNPTEYLNDGFDEIQVYYAINTLFEELQARGFKDPDLSTRPFDAFLFNPDVAYQDNAYYTDDTINFTTYSPKQGNMARDNTTIWHELGHGVMDRLMGDQIRLADTGGLSEGMADFVAALVVQAVTQGVPFPGSENARIINKTGFSLTNEVHDDGESYGGAMKDFLDAVIAQNPKKGLEQVTDVVLEAMRLTRDYPGLTAPDWFEHVLFADSLGRAGLREPGELKTFLLAALAGRNFKLDGGKVATFAIVNTANNQDILPGSPGSRQSPILVNIPKTDTAKFELKASLQSSDTFKFHYPVKIRVQFDRGPLQGAVHWVGKENGTQEFVLNSESDLATIPLQVTGTCDKINRADGSCVDYAYIQVLNSGDTERPTAKKRFYLRVKN